MMTVEQAIEVVDEFVSNKGADLHTQAWQVLRSHIEGRVVTDEDVGKALDVFYDDQNWKKYAPEQRIYAMRSALQAVLGVGK